MIKNELPEIEALALTQEKTLNEEYFEPLAMEAQDEELMENPWEGHREPNIRQAYWADDDPDADEGYYEGFCVQRAYEGY